MHATSDGAYLEASLFAEALEDGRRRCLEPGVPFHIHFSDIAYANRNEKHHLPYGEGTLRADPLREALERFERPGDRDLRVARRGVEPGDQVDLARTLRPETRASLLMTGRPTEGGPRWCGTRLQPVVGASTLGVPRSAASAFLHLRRLVVAVARGGGTSASASSGCDLMRRGSRVAAGLVRLPQQTLRRRRPSPAAARTSPSRKPRRDRDDTSPAPTVLARLEREVAPPPRAALVEQHLGQEALALDHRPSS
jgi:hypothetical protein